MRKRLGTKQEDIDLIRGSDAGVTELAKLTGYSRANVALIRAYKTNKHGTEFAGLIR